MGVLGAQRVAGKHQIHGLSEGHQPRQMVDGVVGENSPFHLEQPEIGLGGRDPYIAVGGPLHARADGQSVDGGNERFGVAAERLIAAVGFYAFLFSLIGPQCSRPLGHLPQVGASREGAAHAGDYTHSHFRVVGEFRQRQPQFLAHLRTLGVQTVRAVHGEDGEVAIGEPFVSQVRHCSPPLNSPAVPAGPRPRRRHQAG